jgi:hypothetical protein
MLSRLAAGDEPKSILADVGFTALRVAVGLMMAVGHGLAKVPPAAGFVDAVGEWQRCRDSFSIPRVWPTCDGRCLGRES